MPRLLNPASSRYSGILIQFLRSAGLAAMISWGILPGSGLTARAQQSQPTASPQPQNNAPEAGGPQGDIGPIAVPKKTPEEPKKEEAPKPPPKVEGMPEFSLRVNVPLVTLDVGVLSKDGMFIPGLKQENFRVLEDGVPQKVTGFNQVQAPITAVMLVEFSKNFYPFEYDALYGSYVFASTLKKEDWIALVSYDIRPHMLSDFTQDKRNIYDGLRSMQIPMSGEMNLFDALYDTLDRLEGVEGRKYIILISSGRDSFSKHNLDQMLKKVQATRDVAIYVVATGKALLEYAQTHGMMRYLCQITEFNCEMTFLQGDNQMKAIAKMTGGKFYEPMFDGQLKEIYADISQTIRNQYAIAYHPTNSAMDGTFRKIKVELVDSSGHPLKMKDEKGKDIKYQIVARDGYKAKQQVE